MINKTGDCDEESSILLHELGHLKYASNFSKFRFRIPFSDLFIHTGLLYRGYIDEVAACYLELAMGMFYFDPECYDTNNGAYEAANALLKSKIDRRNVWNSLVKARSLDQVVQKLNGNLKPEMQKLLLDISRK